MDQLGGDLTSQWEVASRLQLEVERQKRMENDYRRDLAQKNAQIDELKSELKNKTGKSFFYISRLWSYRTLKDQFRRTTQMKELSDKLHPSCR